jgi:hypothetical protein
MARLSTVAAFFVGLISWTLVARCQGPTAQDPPGVYLNQPPTLPPVAPRMPAPPAYPPFADPQVIFFDPYFFPTHYNFRPLPWGLAPTDIGFFYGAYASPYYNQYYGPGDYLGF